MYTARLRLKHTDLSVQVPTDLAPEDIVMMRGWFAGLLTVCAVQAECYEPSPVPPKGVERGNSYQI